MKMEGLFRVPGPAAYTDELRKGFEEGSALWVGRVPLCSQVVPAPPSQGGTLWPMPSVRLMLLRWPV